MFVTLWEYEVKPGNEERFEKTYGPEGDWAELFRKDANYQETRLLRDATRATIYLTLDFWKSQQAYEGFMELHAAEYKKLEAAGEKLTRGEREIGRYEKVDVRLYFWSCLTNSCARCSSLTAPGKVATRSP